ncbi:DUF4129 domain-containing protein [Rhodopirellula sp. JC740]|uniref:DUF4129 domain-containing protein n=1 Tax=Rhodopirellula halodulae TaxID=2894198 RepID=A0ABS8NQR6_9BACT|nr:DUF4129 domain-containing protein [Rhodopirellula sp. JC740]MCC9645307.1 DUF4129 domain-containing protein [Rhodopirellula sp. JC740]
MSRPHHTAADYAAIGIAPLLIFVMLFSLASFLCLVLYSGHYSGALLWTMLMYTMGATAVARITIEHNRQYANAYALALGVATVYVLITYVGNPIFAVAITVLISYLADRIVHDCTIIDDSVDSSGQGLVDSGLSFLRLHRKKRSSDSSLQGTSPKTPNVATSDGEPDVASSNDKHTKRKRKEGHQPGRTVLWLAFGALPLFGIGQFFLGGPSSSWNLARILLTLYLFSALSLLVVTSFLNLRRYLRQRKTEMPLDATVAWLAGGICIIGLILLIAYIAPLPGKAVASIRVPEFLTNREPLSASEYGWGNEGAELSDENDAQSSDVRREGSPGNQTEPGGQPGGQQGNREDGPAGSDPGGKQQGKGQEPGSEQSAAGQKNESSSNPSNSKSPEGKQSSSQSKQSPSNQNQSQNQASGKNESQNNPSGKQDSSSKQNSSSDPSQSQPQESSNSSTDDSSDSDSSASENESAPDSDPQSQPPSQANQETDNREREDANQPDQSSSQSSQPPKDQPLSARTRPPPSRSPSLGGVLGLIGNFLKWIILLGLFLFIAYFVYNNLDAIMHWWDSLFGEEETPKEETSPTKTKLQPTTPPRPFASFRNPIGEADSKRVVVVTFQALEAWCREQGVERAPDETPSEFVRRVAKQFPTLSQSAVRVVDAYNRIVYGRASAGRDDVQAASSVWQVLAGGNRTS